MLRKTLKALKVQVEESINLLESRDENIDDNAIKHLQKCTEYLSAFQVAIKKTAKKTEDTIEELQEHSVRSLTEQRGELEEENSEPLNKSEISQNYPKFNLDEEIDNLDDLDFDKFFQEARENEKSGKRPNIETNEADPQSSIVENSTPKVVDVIIQDSNEQSNLDNYFDDNDFDDEDMRLIDEAEKSAHDDEDFTELLTGDDELDDNIQPAIDSAYLDVLKQYFGFSSFRPMQWKIINSVLNEKRDNCVIMATGYGKSLTFQFPSVFTKRTSIVISPLISLMEDQVHGLKASNIKACFLGSAQANSIQIKDEIFRGHYRLVYVTPEFAVGAMPDFKRLNKEVGIDLIAIDEAHCVSQWGHDFRASYRKLGCLKKEFPEIPILAVTATATVEIRRDICRSLNLVNPNMTCTSFDRPNLYLSVSSKTNDIASDLKRELKLSGNKFVFDGPTIIYCPTKKKAEEVTSVLSGLDVPCLPYHASLSLAARKKAHHQFLNDQIQVIVATVAFGMGIDKPDVRKIIHYGAPKDIESYYQEIGRAGRDGLPSICTAIFSKADFNISKHFIREIGSEKFKQHKLKMFSKVEQYLTTPGCRRRILLSHFEAGNLNEFGGTENCCDNCRLRLVRMRHGLTVSHTRGSEEEADFAKEAADLFKAIEVTGNRYGLTVPTQVLLGSSIKKVEPFKKSKIFGSGKYRSAKFWSALGKALVYEGYLREKSVSGSFGSTVEMTPQARSWLDQRQFKGSANQLLLTPTVDLRQELDSGTKKHITYAPKLHQIPSLPRQTMPIKLLPVPLEEAPAASSSVAAPKPIDEKAAKLEAELYALLVKLRNEMSQETGFVPHKIASNRVLLDMTKFRPSTRTSLLRLEDFSDVKADNFGDKFLELINSFCSKSTLKTDNFPVMDSMDSENSMACIKDELMKLTDTQRQSYMMFALQNCSLEEVASKRGLKTSTVVSHLCEAVKVGLTFDIRRLGLTPEIEKLISDTIWAPPVNGVISSLTKIKDQLPAYVEYNYIKVIISNLVLKHGEEINDNGERVLIGVQTINSESAITSKGDSTDSDVEITSIAPTPPLKKQRLSMSQSTSSSNLKLASAETPGCETTLKTSLSNSQAQPLNPFLTQSQLSLQKQVKSFPPWMGKTTDKTIFTKKIKSGSLFK